jgi:hypothetical protein
MTRLWLKLESKDILLLWVWHSDRASLQALHIQSQLFMPMLTCQSYLAIVAQALALSPLRREPFLRSASLWQGAVLER